MNTSTDVTLVRIVEFVSRAYFQPRPIQSIKKELDECRGHAFDKWCGQPRCSEQWDEYYSDWRLVDQLEEELSIAEKAAADAKEAA